MKKRLICCLMIITLFSTYFATSWIVFAKSPSDEITNLRKTIKNIRDINPDNYGTLKSAVLKRYTDVIEDAWYMSVMVKLVGLGALDGSLENTMDPEGVVTKAMFIKMLVRSMFGMDRFDIIDPDFDHWAAKDVKYAENVGLISLGEYTLKNLSDSITRVEMAKIINRAYYISDIKPLYLEDCLFLADKIKDYNTMTPQEKENILIVYGSGIISGYNDGRFAPYDKANRAQASAFIIRLLDDSERAKVEFPKKVPPRELLTLRYDDPDRPMAIEGDTFIKPDGTAVVLKIGPSGVLGEGQGCATEIGRSDRGGIIREGDLGADEEFLGQQYLICKKTGEGHYKTEWLDISQFSRRRALKELGHPAKGTTYGPWLEYDGGMWIWTGPIRYVEDT